MGSLISRDILADIRLPDISDPLFSDGNEKDIFSSNRRKCWNGDSTDEARCDFAPNKIRITPRSGLWFFSIWKKSVKGRTLRDIKADDDMITFFADNTARLIQSVLGSGLNEGGFALVTTPPRRHKLRNFAELTAQNIAALLGLKFYSRCAMAASRQRIGAVFSPQNIPAEKNIIVFDDIVTTGQTLAAMKELLGKFGKNCCFFTGINNSL